MKLSVNVVHQGCYVKAGDPLPEDFILPEHLDRFAIYDEPSQTSRVDLRSSLVEGQSGVETRLAKPAMESKDSLHREGYPEGEEEFTPKWPRAKSNANKKMKGLKKP